GIVPAFEGTSAGSPGSTTVVHRYGAHRSFIKSDVLDELAHQREAQRLVTIIIQPSGQRHIPERSRQTKILELVCGPEAIGRIREDIAQRHVSVSFLCEKRTRAVCISGIL